MPKRIVSRTRQFDCPKCNRSVTFRYLENVFSSDEVDNIATSLEKVTDYGECQVAAEATRPGHPLFNEIDKCPVYQALDSKH